MATAGIISALVSGAAGVPGFGNRRAEASCITWQGGQNCDSPAPRATYHYQAPARSHGGGYRSYGGGGGRAAAALGAASAAIGILGMMIDAAQQEQNAADESQRQAHNACQGRYHQAHAINEEARKLSANGNADGAYAQFERALDVLGRCGARSDLAALRNNLESARTQYAKYATPSDEWKGDDRTNASDKIRVQPGALDPAARQLCNFAAENSPQWQACMAARKADAIMMADGDIRAACQSIADIDMRNQCAFNRYWAGIQGKGPNRFGDAKNCYFDEHGKPCYPGGRDAVANNAPAVKADDDPNSLRNKLKRALAEQTQPSAVESARAAAIAQAKSVRDSLAEGSEDRKRLDDVIAKAEAGDSSTSAGAAPEQAQAAQPGAGSGNGQSAEAAPGSNPPSKDDTYENYMNSGNASSGGKNNGDLGRSDFSMKGSETDREVKRLMGQ